MTIKAIYAGSFDPPTLGHLDIMNRSLDLCDELIVPIAVNANKKSLFTDAERLWLLAEATKDMLGHIDAQRVYITLCNNLLVDYAESNNVRLFIRGVRSTVDFEYEYSLSQINRSLNSSIQTIFLPADPNLSIVSSSMVKELAKYKKDCSRYVPACVAEALKEKFGS